MSETPWRQNSCGTHERLPQRPFFRGGGACCPLPPGICRDQLPCQLMPFGSESHALKPYPSNDAPWHQYRTEALPNPSLFPPHPSCRCVWPWAQSFLTKKGSMIPFPSPVILSGSHAPNKTGPQSPTHVALPTRSPTGGVKSSCEIQGTPTGITRLVNAFMTTLATTRSQPMDSALSQVDPVDRWESRQRRISPFKPR